MTVVVLRILSPLLGLVSENRQDGQNNDVFSDISENCGDMRLCAQFSFEETKAEHQKLKGISTTPSISVMLVQTVHTSFAHLLSAPAPVCVAEVTRSPYIHIPPTSNPQIQCVIS